MLNSDVAYQIMWNRLISVVEEQAQALIRTAFATSVREAGDLSAGVYDQQGRMLAQAVTGTPGHVNAMADAVARYLQYFIFIPPKGSFSLVQGKALSPRGLLPSLCWLRSS